MEAPILLMLMIDQKTIDTIYILKILVWAFNFITNKITSGLNIFFFLTKNTMLLFFILLYIRLYLLKGIII